VNQGTLPHSRGSLGRWVVIPLNGWQVATRPKLPGVGGGVRALKLATVAGIVDFRLGSSRQSPGHQQNPIPLYHLKQSAERPFACSKSDERSMQYLAIRRSGFPSLQANIGRLRTQPSQRSKWRGYHRTVIFRYTTPKKGIDNYGLTNVQADTCDTSVH